MLVVRPIPRPRALPGDVLDGLLGLVVVLVVASAWTTHVVVCTLEGLWGFLAVGLVVFPVAVLHGLAVWLAVWV